MTRLALTRTIGVGLLGLAVAACDFTAGAPPIDPGLPADERSERSLALERHYARVEQSLLAQGLLRVDGGGLDTPYTVSNLARNFERIAFYDEYAQDRGFEAAEGEAGGLRKWAGPVRLAVDFGKTVPQEQRERDVEMVVQYAQRLAHITGHPVSTGSAAPNFRVLFMGEDDRAEALARIQEFEPGISAGSVAMIEALPRSIHCIVVAFAVRDDLHTYKKAVALIRSEHPDLTRQSCVHEELAQGLGLSNDSPRARPSIFNDDDEFALLTTHDEELLRLLYNPALTPGMTPDEARPIVQRLLRERYGPS